MTRTRSKPLLYGCVGCGRVLYNLKWNAVLYHMQVCCPERTDQPYLRSRCQIGARYCEVPGLGDSHDWERDSYYSQHSDHDSYRHRDQRDSYYGSWNRHEEYVPSQQGNDANYSYYGPSSADDQFRMSLLQASKQRMVYGTDTDTINDTPQELESPVMDLQASKHRVHADIDNGLAPAQEAAVLPLQAHPLAGVKIKIEDTSTKHSPVAAVVPPLQARDPNVAHVRIIKMDDTQLQKAALPLAREQNAELPTKDATDAAVKEVSQWLEKKVSHWSSALKKKSTMSLIDYGFDSAAILDRDLRVDNAVKILITDVGMKRGHALSLRHALEDELQVL